jgi:hypothetical protein
MADTNNDLSRLPQSERRRLIFLKSVSKYRDLGIHIDGNPRFMELIEQWIDGRIEMKDVAMGSRARGFGFVESKSSAASTPDAHQPALQDSSAVAWLGDEAERTAEADDEDLQPRPSQDELLRAIDDLVSHIAPIDPGKVVYSGTDTKDR